MNAPGIGPCVHGRDPFDRCEICEAAVNKAFGELKPHLAGTTAEIVDAVDTAVARAIATVARPADAWSLRVRLWNAIRFGDPIPWEANTTDDGGGGYFDRDGDELHVELKYPGQPGRPTAVVVGLESVRAADDIRLVYDFRRDGWAVQRATRFSWDEGEDIDHGWVEVAYLQSWPFGDPDDLTGRVPEGRQLMVAATVREVGPPLAGQRACTVCGQGPAAHERVTDASGATVRACPVRIEMPTYTPEVRP